MIALLALGLALVDPPMIVAVRPVPPAPAAAAAITAPTTSTTPIVSLFSEDDYPVEAMRLGQQGTVSVDVAISSTGRPSVCTVTTAGATRRTASVIAVRRDVLSAWSVVGSWVAGLDALAGGWASDRLGVAPSHAASATKSAGPNRRSERDRCGITRCGITWCGAVWRAG